ncbi:D-2-hydroxyacid dehydrogenase [Oleiharenicola lentus]|uniref:D-2-hydroxyacid dehydrogenase n=1 Tax=Oleiharenicola lentus TaxID=2508720 RepID=UPI003F6666DC
MSLQRITLCHAGLGGEWFERIQKSCAAWATVEMAPEKSPAARDAVLASDIVVGWPESSTIAEGRCRFFQCGSTGYEAYIGQGLEKKPGFVMSNSAGTMSIPVAEHGIALMLAGTRNLSRHAQDQVNCHFERYPPYREVTGTTACICGLGSIGTELARRCLGLGMKVIGVRQDSSKPHPLVSEIYPLEHLADAVARADHVFIVLPLNLITRGCFNARIFASMKRGSGLYSLARGAHIIESELITALENGQVGFAGLDVFTQEPLPAQSALWGAPNTLITPHCSGRSAHEFRRMCDLVVDNLQRFHARQELRNVVMKNF